MTGGLTINAATPADAAAVTEIYAHHVRHGVATFETEPPDVAEIGRRIAKVLSAGHPWLIARDGAGAVLGYAYAGQFHPRAAYRFACEDSIYLAHDRQGEGIGTVLLAALVAGAEAAGFRQMIAQITAPADGGSAEVRGGSIALHRKLGFVEAGRIVSAGRKHRRWLDIVLMQLALGPGDRSAPPEEP